MMPDNIIETVAAQELVLIVSLSPAEGISPILIKSDESWVVWVPSAGRKYGDHTWANHAPWKIL
jgi:hypothetical protein